MTEQQIERLRELKAKGLTDLQIGKEMNYTRSAIFKTRKINGIPGKRRGGVPYKVFYFRENGKVVAQGTAKDLAEKYGLSISAIYSACRAKKWRGMIVESERIVREGCD